MRYRSPLERKSAANFAVAISQMASRLLTSRENSCRSRLSLSVRWLAQATFFALSGQKSSGQLYNSVHIEINARNGLIPQRIKYVTRGLVLGTRSVLLPQRRNGKFVPYCRAEVALLP